jgi:hypothetical protein
LFPVKIQNLVTHYSLFPPLSPFCPLVLPASPPLLLALLCHEVGTSTSFTGTGRSWIYFAVDSKLSQLLQQLAVVVFVLIDNTVAVSAKNSFHPKSLAPSVGPIGRESDESFHPKVQRVYGLVV